MGDHQSFDLDIAFILCFQCHRQSRYKWNPSIAIYGKRIVCMELFFKSSFRSRDVNRRAQALVKKIYFPRLVIPVSKAISGIIELFVVLVILFILLILLQVPGGSKNILVTAMHHSCFFYWSRMWYLGSRTHDQV
jgi:ABC-type polysaccharide/polyol phosphate export permease